MTSPSAGAPVRPDLIARFMTPEGSFRILIARSTELVRTGVAFAQTEAAITEVYGDLLTGAALLQHAQGPAERFQIELQHAGSAGTMLADARFGPIVRGRVERPRPSELGPEFQGRPSFSGPAVVTVSRFPDAAMVQGRGSYRSQVPVEGTRIDGALQQFVLESEQVLTVFALATIPDGDGDVRVAGGFIVQALPGFDRDHLKAVTECLEKASFEDLVRAGDDPVDAALALFDPLRLHHLGSDTLAYRCRCSREAAIRLVTLLTDDERANLRAGGFETVVCEFCGTAYPVSQLDLGQTVH